MKKAIVFFVLLILSLASFLISVLYFSNPQHRKEKIEEYKQKIERRKPQ